MTVIHQELAQGRWFALSLTEQMGNIGSEVERTIRAKQKNDPEKMIRAFYRALDLLDLTMSDARFQKRLKEIARAREVLCDYFVGENEYHTTAEFLSKYFLAFGMAARKKR